MLFLQAGGDIRCSVVAMLEALGSLSAPKKKVVITDPFFFFLKWKLNPGHKYARKVLGYHCYIPCPFSILRQGPGLELGDSAKAFWVTEIAGTCHYMWL